jgi:hypothetical protein
MTRALLLLALLPMVATTASSSVPSDSTFNPSMVATTENATLLTDSRFAALVGLAHTPHADSARFVLLLASPAALGIMEHLRPTAEPQPVRAHRNDALLNGALIAVGAAGILDNVIAHWILGLHRAVPGEHALAVEIGIVAVSAAMLGAGLWRERNARRALAR